MKKSFSSKLLNYLKQKDKATVTNISKDLGVSRQFVHRQIKNLLEGGEVEKVGRPPKVFYKIKKSPNKFYKPKLKSSVQKVLSDYYAYVSPSGNFIGGVEGFTSWCLANSQTNNIEALSIEYSALRSEINALFNDLGLVDATSKINETFNKCYLEKVFYLDFYSIPKFGKTKTGQMVLHAKQSGNLDLIKQLVQMSNAKIKLAISTYKIDAVAFIPPTVKRQVQFLTEFERYLDTNLPKIKLIKAYSGDIRVPQKTLSKLIERIENASETIYIDQSSVSYKNVLLIDDAVGSGASLNQVAKKLKAQNNANKVYGLSIVGSYKGFDVISEV
jgi:biotin operon repressor